MCAEAAERKSGRTAVAGRGSGNGAVCGWRRASALEVAVAVAVLSDERVGARHDWDSGFARSNVALIVAFVALEALAAAALDAASSRIVESSGRSRSFWSDACRVCRLRRGLASGAVPHAAALGSTRDGSDPCFEARRKLASVFSGDGDSELLGAFCSLLKSTHT